MDNKLIDGRELKRSFLKKQDLLYYVSGENEDYLAPDLLGVTPKEEETFFSAAKTAFEILRDTVAYAAGSPKLLKLCGVPEVAHNLIGWSVNNEWNDFLVGRFDFAGGFEGAPIKLIEFNADTCSLLPETTVLQPELVSRARKKPGTNTLFADLVARLLDIKRRITAHSDSILLAEMGHDDDYHNAHVVARAARQAGFKTVQHSLLENVQFDPDYGVSLQHPATGDYVDYGLLFKFFPWEFAFQEEPELGELLAEMTMNKQVKVLNPAWTMLLQSKGLMALAWERYPQHHLLLESHFSPSKMRAADYVEKPFYGRSGENITFFSGGRSSGAATSGHYRSGPMLYQERTEFASDSDGDYYQASVFFTDRPSTLAVRRQDNAIMNDDAEFIATFRG